MTTPSVSDVNEFEQMPMNQLVAWFNAHCREAEKIKAFRTKIIGTARCSALFAQMEEQKKFDEETADMSDEDFQKLMMSEIENSARKENPQVVGSVREAIEEATMQQDVHLSSRPLVMPKHAVRQQKDILKHNGEGVRDSWLDPDVHARRTMRNHVFVHWGNNREEFRSVRQAFEQLGLPLKSHIRFRGKLKAEGERTFIHEGEDYVFEVIERGDIAK